MVINTREKEETKSFNFRVDSLACFWLKCLICKWQFIVILKTIVTDMGPYQLLLTHAYLEVSQYFTGPTWLWAERMRGLWTPPGIASVTCSCRLLYMICSFLLFWHIYSFCYIQFCSYIWNSRLSGTCYIKNV